MGQLSSIEDHFDSLPAVLMDLLSEEKDNLTYEQFLRALNDLNNFSKSCISPENGEQLIFAIKKGSDTTIFWKATVQIACVRIDTRTNKISTFRLLSLGEFLNVFKTIKCQNIASEQAGSSNSVNSKKVEGAPEIACSSTKECCICYERKQEVILPCMHSYCTKCIEAWNANHDTCPICRQILEDPEDSWLIIPGLPNSDEIKQEIKSTLMQLAED